MCVTERHVDFFFFNDTATTEIYTLSLHDALPISSPATEPTALGHSNTSAPISAVTRAASGNQASAPSRTPTLPARVSKDRKSTRLNSSHANISYAVFCLKKKKLTPHLPCPHTLHI